MKKSPILMLGAACLLAASPSLACEKHRKQQQQNPDVVVHPYGIEDAITVPSYLRKSEEMRRTPGSVVVVPQEKFEKKYTLNLKDMLGDTPGVYAQPRYGEEVRFSIRGSGLSRGFHLRGVQLLQDGIPMNQADGGSDFQEIDPLAIQYTEVYKGANALRYGAASLGGAVNFVSPTARNVDYNTLFRIEGGSWGTLRSHVAAAQKNETLDAYVSATGSLAEGYRNQSRQKTGRMRGNIGVKLSDNAETRFYLAYNNVNQEVPGTLSRNDALNNPRSALATNVNNDHQRDLRSVRFSNTTTVRLDHNNQIEFGAFVNDRSLFHPIFQVIDNNTLDWGGFSRFKTTQRFYGLSHDFLLGVNYHGGENNAKQYLNSGGSKGTPQSHANQTSSNFQAYGEAHLKARSDLTFIFGVQGVASQRELENLYDPTRDGKENFYAFNPKLGTLWDVTPATQIFANVSRSSEMPTFSELVQQPVIGFVPLDPQTAWTAELGTRGHHGRLSWDVSAYRAWIRDEMLQFTTNPSTPAATFNADHTIHQGFETGFGYSLARNLWKTNDHLSFQQSYTLNDFFFVNDDQYGDNDIAGAPKHVLISKLRYEQPGWSVTPVIEWAPDAPYVDFANTLKATEYVVLNLQADMKINDNIEIFAEGRNLLDRNYVSSYSTITDAGVAGTNVFYPGEGRSFYAGVKAKF